MILRDTVSAQFEVGIDEIDMVVDYLESSLKKNTIWLFRGDLGAGKTFLIQRLLSRLEILDQVSSPTYAIVNEYMSGEGRPIYHFDFYRLNSQKEALDIGIMEYFESQNLCLIEWPDLVTDLLPPERIEIMISHLSPEIRQYTIKHYE